jgi:hypothetical protein
MMRFSYMTLRERPTALTAGQRPDIKNLKNLMNCIFEECSKFIKGCRKAINFRKVTVVNQGLEAITAELQ